MLKNVPPIISPDLMHVLMSMGHGDSIVIADGNFPAGSNAQRLVRADGHGAVELLKAVMRFFPLDTYSDEPACVMQVLPGDAVETPIWAEFARVLSEAEGRDVALTEVPREEFYERAREAYAIVATSEVALYANLLLVKGVVTGGA
jgi:L-fucose mutarotase